MTAARRSAVVTGGGSGIGRSICSQLARAGVAVGVLDINPAGAQQTAADVAADAAYAAYASAAYGDIDYAAYAAEAAADVRNDLILSEFAEDIVQILSDMNAPGCVWLDLTDAKP